MIRPRIILAIQQVRRLSLLVVPMTIVADCASCLKNIKGKAHHGDMINMEPIMTFFREKRLKDEEPRERTGGVFGSLFLPHSCLVLFLEQNNSIVVEQRLS